MSEKLGSDSSKNVIPDPTPGTQLEECTETETNQLELESNVEPDTDRIEEIKKTRKEYFAFYKKHRKPFDPYSTN